MGDSAVQILRSNKLRKTPIRHRVLQLFIEENKALSNKELERMLGSVDRITLYRTLKTFEKNGIIHEAFDGTENTKYALCHQACSEHEHQDNHAHFNCVVCDKTICLDKLPTPHIDALEGLAIKSSHLFLKGQCGECMSDQNK